MTGYAVPGVQRFVAKEGVPFDRRLNVQFHSDELELVASLKAPEESLADVVRLALREWLRREGAKRSARHTEHESER